MLNDLNNALDVLSSGGIILYPTDTIWGIGCDATNESAVDKIYSLKKRKDEKSMIMLLDSDTKLSLYVNQIPGMALELIRVADKPLTIIYPEAKNIARNLISDDGSVGIRIVSDDFCNILISRFGKPIVSTSANISGSVWPANFSDIDHTVIESVDYVVKWRQYETSGGRPSGIIKVELNGGVKVIRTP
ncbi:MAG: threonylcarbamoyl-AMP synthase [Bacteroidales bacterium]|nr:threonylcarbamoyl-AMP synthase [Bacteroidales bacterium]